MAEGCQLQSLSEETLCLGAGPAVVFPLPHVSCAGGSSSGQVLVPHCWPLWAGKGDIAPASSVSSAPERGALLGIFFSPREVCPVLAISGSRDAVDSLHPLEMHWFCSEL